MDKMRAIQYFNRAAEAGTFAAAARSFDVSTPAVTQLVAALERSLGTTLFHRTGRGLALTADGERYYEVSRVAAAGLVEVEKRLGQRGAKPRGTLTVGMRSSVAQNCVMPRIARFLERFPDIELVAKPVETLEEFDAQDVDLVVTTGWPPERDFVVRPLAQTRNMVCASPEYWLREGKPEEPEALRNHHCLVFRSSGGALLDRWTFERNGERRTVDVSSRLLSYHGTWIQEAACAGAGVIRAGDLSLVRFISSGLLVPALTDWEALDSPSHFVVYRQGQRRSKLVRVFVDFLIEVFAELEVHRPAALGHPMLREPMPEWFGRARGRQSEYAARRRSSR
jgi:DNA-binding transcriptional LysR family regulator